MMCLPYLQENKKQKNLYAINITPKNAYHSNPAIQTFYSKFYNRNKNKNQSSFCIGKFYTDLNHIKKRIPNRIYKYQMRTKLFLK